jgi:hypothetical protein
MDQLARKNPYSWSEIRRFCTVFACIFSVMALASGAMAIRWPDPVGVFIALGCAAAAIVLLMYRRRAVAYLLQGLPAPQSLDDVFASLWRRENVRGFPLQRFTSWASAALLVAVLLVVYRHPPIHVSFMVGVIWGTASFAIAGAVIGYGRIRSLGSGWLRFFATWLMTFAAASLMLAVWLSRS